MKHGLLIDMDGVIYSGEDLIPGADRFIANLLKNNIPFTFMTNNSQRTRLEAVRKLKRLGIEVSEEHVYTSAMATGKFLGDQSPNGTTAYVLGEGGLLTSLHENGVTLVDSDPEFVVLGEGRNFTLEMVQRAVDMILAGAKFITTNRDPSPKKPGWNNLGIARDLQGHHEGAQIAYRQCLGIDPQNSAAVVNLALSLAMGGRADEGVRILGPLATSANASVKMRHDYAVTLALAGRQGEAEEILSADLSPEEVRQALDSVNSARGSF